MTTPAGFSPAPSTPGTDRRLCSEPSADSRDITRTVARRECDTKENRAQGPSSNAGRSFLSQGAGKPALLKLPTGRTYPVSILSETETECTVEYQTGGYRRIVWVQVPREWVRV